MVETATSDTVHTEPIDHGTANCPRCQSDKINWVFTKRGISLKCLQCGYDTHYLQDVVGHRSKELEALPYLKAISPDLNLIENVDYGWEYLLETEKENQHLIYDAKVFFGRYKLERLKVAVVQNTTYQKYVDAEQNYMQGRPDVFQKLAKMDALIVFYFPDDQQVKVAVAYSRELAKYAVEVEDLFHNKQYSIPKAIRPALIIADEDRIREMLHRNFMKKIFEKRYVL